jgi:hypothetical protein
MRNGQQQLAACQFAIRYQPISAQKKAQSLGRHAAAWLPVLMLLYSSALNVVDAE